MSILEIITERVEEKPIPSVIAFKLLKLIEDEDHSLKDVTKLVEADPSLTTEVLKVANTPAYYRGNAVSTVNRAILLLGEMMVVGVAICASSSIVFHAPLEGYDSPEGEMWEHSLRTAIAAKALAKYANKNIQPGLAFTAGLLHDIGKSVISEFLIGKSNILLEACGSGKCANFTDAERELLGTDHTKVGYALAEYWGLPESLKIPIRDHHEPHLTLDRYKPFCYLIHLADLLAMSGGCGTGTDSFAYTIDRRYEEHIKLDRNEIEILLLQIQDDFTSIKESIMNR